MQCANLMTNESAFADTTLLQPGETIFHTFWPGAMLSDFTGGQYPKLFNCFLPSQGNEFCRIRCVGFTPTLADDSTRVGCVLRLPAGADPVTSYDIGTRWGMTNSGTNSVPSSSRDLHHPLCRLTAVIAGGEGIGFSYLLTSRRLYRIRSH